MVSKLSSSSASRQKPVSTTTTSAISLARSRTSDRAAARSSVHRSALVIPVRTRNVPTLGGDRRGHLQQRVGVQQALVRQPAGLREAGGFIQQAQDRRDAGAVAVRVNQQHGLAFRGQLPGDVGCNQGPAG